MASQVGKLRGIYGFVKPLAPLIAVDVIPQCKYIKQYVKHKRDVSMQTVGFEPTQSDD